MMMNQWISRIFEVCKVDSLTKPYVAESSKDHTVKHHKDSSRIPGEHGTTKETHDRAPTGPVQVRD